MVSLVGWVRLFEPIIWAVKGRYKYARAGFVTHVLGSSGNPVRNK